MQYLQPPQWLPVKTFSGKNTGVLTSHMQPFSEESLQFYRQHPDIWGLWGRGEKKKSHLHIVKVFHVTPHPIKTLHCQLKLPAQPPPTPSLCPAWHKAQTGLPQTDSGTAFQVPTHPVAGKLSRACQLAVSYPHNILSNLTHKPDHWKSQKTLKCVWGHRWHPVGLFLASEN